MIFIKSFKRSFLSITVLVMGANAAVALNGKITCSGSYSGGICTITCENGSQTVSFVSGEGTISSKFACDNRARDIQDNHNKAVKLPKPKDKSESKTE